MADRVPGVQRLLDPHQVVALEFTAHPAGPLPVPLLVGVDHQRRVAQMLLDRRDPFQVLLPVRLPHFDFDSADAGLERGGGLLLDLVDGCLQEAAGGVVDAAGVAVGADELGQRKPGPSCLEVPQRDVQCGDRLGGHARSADRCACPQQRLVDAVDIGRVCPDRGVGHLGEVGELGPSARALRVAEAHALQALFRGDLGEQEHGLGQRLLPAGEHLGVADRVGQREDDMGKRDVANAVGHRELLEQVI